MRRIVLLIILLLVISSLPIGIVGSSYPDNGSFLSYQSIDDIDSTQKSEIEPSIEGKVQTKVMGIDFSKPTIITENEDYFSVAVEGSMLRNIPGEPQLPVLNVVLKFQPGTKIKSVEVEPINSNYMPGSQDRLYKPSEELVPVSELTYENFKLPFESPLMDEKIYKQPKYFPQTPFEYSTGMGIDPDTDETTLFLAIKIYPIRYQPIDNIINWLGSANIKVKYTEPRAPGNNGPGEPNAGTRGSTAREGIYDMVVITPNEFSDDLAPLIDHKNRVEVPTILVTFSDITSSKHFPVQGDDLQEKIKYFIFNAKKDWDIKNVMLVGDSGKLPIRSASIQGEDSVIPSDLYYADVFNANQNFCDWDANNNGKYGEHSGGPIDGTDLYPDVYLGRLPASTGGEVQNMVNKIITYELTAIGQPWTNNAILCGLDTFSGGTPEGEYLSDQIASKFLKGYTVKKLYESTNTLSSSSIASNVNAGAKFLSFSDHGLVNSWGGHWSKSDVNSLSNGDKLPFVNLDACLSGAWDQGDCLAESFLTKTGGGAIASFASSRVAYGAFGTAHVHAVSGYHNIRLYANYDLGRETPGEMVAAAKWDYLNNVGKNFYTDYKTVVEYNLFGDPSLVIGGLPTAIFNLECEDNQSKVDPGESTEYLITVENLDTTANKIILKTKGVPSGWSAVLDKTEHFMEPETQLLAKLSVTAPTNAKYKANADIKVIGSLSHIQRTISVSTKTKVNRIFGVDLECEDSAASIDPGKATTYFIIVKNEGNYFDTIDLDVTKAPDFWDVELSESSLYLEAYASDTVELKVTSYSNSVADTYIIPVKGSITGTTHKTSLNIETTINPIYNVKLNCSANLFIVKPSETASYPVNVYNKGNTLDNVKLKFDNLPEDWKATFKDKDTVLELNSTAIEPFTSKEIEVIINVSHYALAGEYNLTLAGSSGSNMSLSKTWMIVSVKRISDIKLDCQDYTTNIAPNSTTTYMITVENIGNWEDVIDLELPEVPKNWHVELSRSRNIKLQAFESIEVKLTVTPPLNTEVGEYDILVKGILESDNDKDDYARAITSIDRIYGIELSQNPEYDNKVDPGNTIKYKVIATNKGNDKDIIDVELANDISTLPKSWKITLTKNNDISLNAFASKEFELTIEVPSDEYCGNFRIPMRGTLKSDEKVEHVFDVIIEVTQTYGIKVTALRETITVHPGDNIEYIITVTNTGNGVDEISRRVKNMPTEWEGQFAIKRSFVLKPFESKNETLKISIPPETKLDQYVLDVMVVSMGNSQKYDTMNIVVNVEEEETLGLTAESAGIVSFSIVAIVILLLISLFLVRRKRKAREDERSEEQLAEQTLDYTHPYYQSRAEYGGALRPTVQPQVVTSGTAPPSPWRTGSEYASSSRWGITPTEMTSLQSGHSGGYPQLQSRSDKTAPSFKSHKVSWFEDPGEEPELRLKDRQRIDRKGFDVKWEDEEPELEDDFDLDDEDLDTKGKDIDSLLASLLPSDARSGSRKTPTLKSPTVVKGPKIKPKPSSK